MTNNMQYLWTPWRMAYIAGAHSPGASEEQTDAEALDAVQEADLPGVGPQEKGTGCVFCDRARLSPAHDRASLILLRATHNFIILNLYPYNSAHLMAVPYLHTADFAALSAETLNEMMELMKRMVRVIGEEYGPQGFNLGMNMGNVAGAGVADHIHMHLVPRWAGDTNFMPIVGSTKVMPELLETTYERLKKRVEAEA
jgi:ATP adenylyltransferase